MIVTPCLHSTGVCFHERCVYTERLCAKNRENVFTGISSNTNYLRIIRAFYTIVTSSQEALTDSYNDCPDSGGNVTVPPGLTSRAFTPSRLTVVTSSLPSGIERRAHFEEQKKIIDRINQWLVITGESRPLFFPRLLFPQICSRSPSTSL